MWMAVIAATLISLIGYKSLLVEAAASDSQDNATAQRIADDMAIYRFAVIDRVNAIGLPGPAGPIPFGDLTFPLGYVPPPGAPMWSNQIEPDGTILIFAARTPPVGVASAINQRASSSPLLVQPEVTVGTSSAAPNGTVNTHTALVRSVVAGQPAALQHVPVWLAHRG